MNCRTKLESIPCYSSSTASRAITSSKLLSATEIAATGGSMLTRRKFLVTAAGTVAAARLRAQGQRKVQVTLAIPSDATGPQMPIDFVGLSYEVQQLADPTFFSAQNSGLIREFKALSSRGVLRLGGNTSEFAYWKPTPDSPEPEHPQVREVVGEPKAHYYAVTAEAVRNLAQFLRPLVGLASTASGWARIRRYAPLRKRSS